MALGVVIPQARQIALDANGNPLPGAKLESWLAGTSTPQPLYTTDQLNIPLSNPVIADGNGVFPAMYTEPVALKLELRTAADAVVWFQDNITPANLLTGVIATDIADGHQIGDVAPSNTKVGLTVGGVMPVVAPDTVAASLFIFPTFDASAQPALAFVAGVAIQPEVDLAAAGTPLVYGLSAAAPAISTLGAIPSESASIVIPTMPSVGSNRYGLLLGSSVAAQFGGPVIYSRTVTPGQITSNQNNYAPSNIDVAYLLRLSSDASRNITGLAAFGAGGVHTTANQAGREMLLANVGAFNIVLTNEDAASTASNRFALPGAASFTLTPGLTAKVYYDGTSARWRVLG